MPNGFDIWGLEGLSSDQTGELREVTVATNETVSIYCGAASRYSDSVVWLGVNPDSEGNFPKQSHIKSLQLSLFTVSIENITSDYSYQSKLVINDITTSDEGTIACMAENLHNQVNSLKFINVTIKVSGCSYFSALACTNVQCVNFRSMDTNRQFHGFR